MTTHGELIKNLFNYYRVGVKPTRGAMERWIEKIKFIPEAKLPWIQDYFEDNHDNLPRNLPKAIIHAWYEWRRQYPQHTRGFQTSECQECRGDGIINVRFIDDASGLAYTTFFTCAKCENWKQHIGINLLASHPRKTKLQLEMKGFTII